jgi:hypothetical protein
MSQPEQVGKVVFSILQNLSTETQSEYLDHFLPIDEVRELAKNTALLPNETDRNYYTSLKKEDWEESITEEYIRIKDKAGQAGINWKEIEYLDFTFRTREWFGLKHLEGTFYFKYQGQSFRISSLAYWTGNEWRLSQIHTLVKQ